MKLGRPNQHPHHPKKGRAEKAQFYSFVIFQTRWEGKLSTKKAMSTSCKVKNQ